MYCTLLRAVKRCASPRLRPFLDPWHCLIIQTVFEPILKRIVFKSILKRMCRHQPMCKHAQPDSNNEQHWPKRLLPLVVETAILWLDALYSYLRIQKGNCCALIGCDYGYLWLKGNRCCVISALTPWVNSRFERFLHSIRLLLAPRWGKKIFFFKDRPTLQLYRHVCTGPCIATLVALYSCTELYSSPAVDKINQRLKEVLHPCLHALTK